MVFSSLLFLFRFLPIVLLVYYIAPGCWKNRWRNLVLFFFSLVFYAWGEPVYVVLMLFSTVVDYVNGGLTGYFIQKEKKNIAKIFVICSAVINLSLLFVFKYAGFFCTVWNRVSGMNVAVPELTLPIGISFYTFQTMSYTIDVYRKEAVPEKNIINFGAYVSLFPQLIAGPIVRFRDIAVQLRERKASMEKFSYGIVRFVTGLGKKVLLANNAGLVWTTVLEYSSGELTMAAAWLGLLFYMFQIYFDFSGYSDMAIGLMAMFGFEIPENFDYPYTSKSITEFWRRWHISLGTWFKEYVYIPLGGNRRGMARTFLNIFAVWFLTGFWHGASLNFIFWGLYFWVFLMVEKFIMGKLRQKKQGHFLEENGNNRGDQNISNVQKKKAVAAGKEKIFTTVLRHCYAVLVIYFGWLLFAWEDIAGHRVFLKAMAGIGKAGIGSTQTAYLFVSNVALLGILILGATKIPKKAAEWICGKNEMLAEVLKTVFVAVVFLLATAYLVNETYNPFLYFRF
jgi:alginate O-acetyltransferase complex protein AlgI